MRIALFLKVNLTEENGERGLYNFKGERSSTWSETMSYWADGQDYEIIVSESPCNLKALSDFLHFIKQVKGDREFQRENFGAEFLKPDWGEIILTCKEVRLE